MEIIFLIVVGALVSFLLYKLVILFKELRILRQMFELIGQFLEKEQYLFNFDYDEEKKMRLSYKKITKEEAEKIKEKRGDVGE